MARVRLTCGDALRYLPSIPDESIDCVVTSPPYWGFKAHNGGASTFGNEPTMDEYLATSRILIRQIRRILKREGTVFLNIGNKRAQRSGDLMPLPWHIGLVAREEGFHLRDEVVWNKVNHNSPGNPTNYLRSVHESVLLLTKVSSGYYFNKEASRQPYLNRKQANLQREIFKIEKARTQGLLSYAESLEAREELERRTRQGRNNRIRLRRERSAESAPDPRADVLARDGFCFDDWNEDGALLSNVWNIGREKRDFEHPCPYAVQLPQRCLSIGCPERGLALDPFIGSGTTAIAGLNCNRRVLGVEIVQQHFETAKRRVAAWRPSDDVEADGSLAGTRPSL